MAQSDHHMAATRIKAPQRLAQILIWTIAAFYAYGALVHVLNMLSLTGFDWATAPFKWQLLDVVYLVLDLTVVIGLIMGARFGFLAFFAAALSQIVLYTLLRSWVLSVPEGFRRSPEDLQYLNGLVLFHIVTCLIMAWCVLGSSRRWSLSSQSEEGA